MDPVRDQLQQALGQSYRVDRELGGGGMSRVFLATEAALDRRVVLKVLPPELASGVSVERFQREIALAARLQHAHIVPLLAAGDANGLPWFSMPFVEGQSPFSADSPFWQKRCCWFPWLEWHSCCR